MSNNENKPKVLYDFKVFMAGYGSTPEEAWANALRDFSGEPGSWESYDVDPDEVMPEPDLARPANLSDKGNKAYDIILKHIKQSGLDYTGGCRVFYSQEEWRARGEQYCLSAELIVVYEGSSIVELFDPEEGYLSDSYLAIDNDLADAGLYCELGTNWYAGVFKLSNLF